MNWKKLLESASESVNDQLRLRHDYLVAENRILRNQIDGRVQLTDSERKELAEIGAKLGKQALAEIATVAQADTILAWHRMFATQTVDTSTPPKAVGRPRVDREIEEWVIRMARENRSWGYDRIQGSLKHLGYTISDQTVGNILKRHGIPPAPERKKTVTWREFTRSHLNVLLATDFFTSEVWNGLALLVAFLLSFFHISRHHVHAVGTVLHQLMKGVPSVPWSSLTLSAYLSRSAQWAKKWVRSQIFRFGEHPSGDKASEFTLSHERQPGFQDIGQVVCLSAAYPRPIRDGPCRYHHQVRSPNSNYREAA